jgi:hypothetical protein
MSQYDTVLEHLPETPQQVVTADTARLALRETSTMRAKSYRAAEAVVNTSVVQTEPLSDQQQRDLAASELLYTSMHADYARGGNLQHLYTISVTNVKMLLH